MSEYKAGEPYTLAEYDWLYNNQHLYSVQQMAEITGRDVRSLRGHLEKFGFGCSTLPLDPSTEAFVRKYKDLGDALIFLLPDLPLPVIREAVSAC